jgi:hypothetical protein
MAETVKFVSVQESKGRKERHTCSSKCPTQCTPINSTSNAFMQLWLFPKAISFTSGEICIYTHGNITQAIFANMKHFKLST